MYAKRKHSKLLFVVVISLIIICDNADLWSCDGNREVESNPYCRLADGQFIDSLTQCLYDSFNRALLDKGTWPGCYECTELLDSLENYIKQYDLHDSNQKRRVAQQVIATYRILNTSKLSSMKTNTATGDAPAIEIFWNTYFSLLALKEEVTATFRDSVPDNKAIYDELLLLKERQTNCCSTIATISQTVDSIEKIVSTMATGSFISWGDTLKTLSTTIASLVAQVTPLTTTVTSIASMVTSTATLVDSVLKILHNTSSTPCVVIGLAYYARGVVGGWISVRLGDSSALSLTGEILDYHDQVTASSHRGVKLGGGCLVADKYNISVGLVLFDRNIDPYEKNTLDLAPNVLHHIHISFDYWRSKDISLGIGYSALTGLGGRVLLGL